MYGKIIPAEEVDNKLLHIRANSSKVVFTNGCFDILHAGHIDYLINARSLGSKLIVGVNDDNSVSKLKGAERPITKLADRMNMLAALQCVDIVIPFAESTPLSLIKKIQPQVLVKGGDYTVDTVVGATYVVSLGGEVRILPFKDGYSTTALIEKIKKL